MKHRPSLKGSIPLILTTSCVLVAQAHADAFNTPTLHTSQSDFGGVGLMQMPSGRVAPEGEFTFSGSFNQDYYHGTVSLQLMSWLETTIRYTQVQDMLYNSDPDYSGDNELTDKGIDIKLRLLEEGDWQPETSIGIRDLGGTGLFDGEFLAATKRFGNLDFTLGIGWGYLGTRNSIGNPFCEISDSYCDRDNSYKDNGGSIDYERWFTGPSAIFGGIEYQTPYQPLRLKLEYDSNDYSQDYPVVKAGKNLTPHTPWNFGLLYALGDWGDIKVSYQRGDTLTLGFNLRSNFNEMKPYWRDTPKAAYKPQEYSHNPDWQEVAEQISDNAGYKQNSISTTETDITVRGEPDKYRQLETAHERSALLLSQNRGKNIKTYTFIDKNKNLELKKTSYNADKFDEVANYGYIGATLEDAKLEENSTTRGAEPRLEPVVEKKLAEYKQPLDYGFAPTISQSFGGAENFYLYAIGVTGSAGYRLLDNLELSGSLYLNLMDNYDQFNFVEDDPHIDNFSVPRVRTLFRYYVHDNLLRMNNLQLTWFEQLGESLFFQGYGGYLETMFAGVGGEILYRPANSSWAIGADLTLVSQRNPDHWFTMYSDDYFEFNSGCTGGDLDPSCAAYVLSRGETGFVSLYYTPRWEFIRNTKFKLSAGQFLGQDQGVRMDFSKQFDSGVITGVYASISDLTSDEYGEGSFTKGFYISMPLDVLTVKPSRNRAHFYWEPITRDGGQTLSKKYDLFEVTDSRSPWFTRANGR